MKPIKTVTVKATLPGKISDLQGLAYNLCWTWNHEAMDLFQRLSPELWDATDHNPVKMLGMIIQPRLDALACDDSFLAQLERVKKMVEEYMNGQSWYDRAYGRPQGPLVAYFSMEFGITEAIPIYSGGLGMLAGDHLKSCAEMGIPLVGVGLLYRVGYFRQSLNEDGMQAESFSPNDFYDMPLERVCDDRDRPVLVSVEYPGRIVRAQVWKAQVGRVPLYFLDTDIPDNGEGDRQMTRELYGGDAETRMMQEIMLGIGGVRLLTRLGIRPEAYHMNEGHSAFLALERASRIMVEHGLSFPEAMEVSRSGNVFTTHTPVPAGIDVFPSELMGRFFGDYAKKLGLHWDEFMAMGRQNPSNRNEGFSMAVLALHCAASTNAVSRLHASVSRSMWQGVWPAVPPDEIPIIPITNGIHHRSWISREMAELYMRYLGPRWLGDPSDHSVWQNVRKIPDEELWGTHSRRRERLVAYVRRRIKAQVKARGASPSEIATYDEILDPRTLTIGFARRFAAYKRASLLFFNADRLASILNNKDMPVQIIFAGKAHPRDGLGKDLIKRVVQMSKKENLRRKVVFLEDYDQAMARYLVQGADIWLNTPRRPLEASGTSGMKAAANGALNMSILDGWWDEAYEPGVGWAIGRREDDYPDQNSQDAGDSNHIYKLLEEEIVPMFYDVGQDSVPNRWVAKMKESMASICPFFNTNRMVRDYLDKMYFPGMKRTQELSGNGFEKARRLAAWKSAVRDGWGGVSVERVSADPMGTVPVGATINVAATVRLGKLKPSDVSVQIYEGRVDANGEMMDTETVEMQREGPGADGGENYSGSFRTSEAGQYGLTIRVLPCNKELSCPVEPGLIFWAK